MSTFDNKEGIWILYDYDVGSYIISVHPDIVPAARQAARQAYGRVGFWPFGMERDEAINWWEGRQKDHLLLEDSIIHFFYITTFDNKTPICEDVDRDEWVQFDHTARGKICPNCEVKLGREIK